MSKLSVTIDGRTFVVELSLPLGKGVGELTALVDGQPVEVATDGLDGVEQPGWILVDGRSHEVVFDRDLRWVRSHNGLRRLEVRDTEATVTRPLSGDGRIKAPIPGLITRVLVRAGDTVEAGQPLLVLEAMKMENEIRAPRAGVVRMLSVAPGKGVALQELLAEIG